jgi:hypothetical protein
MLGEGKEARKGPGYRKAGYGQDSDGSVPVLL